jgi:hypothetical protein
MEFLKTTLRGMSRGVVNGAVWGLVGGTALAVILFATPAASTLLFSSGVIYPAATMLTEAFQLGLVAMIPGAIIGGVYQGIGGMFEASDKAREVNKIRKTRTDLAAYDQQIALNKAQEVQQSRIIEADQAVAPPVKQPSAVERVKRRIEAAKVEQGRAR